MPVYSYICETCEDSFELRHSYKEKVCKRPGCLEECTLQKIPSKINIAKEGIAVAKTGEIVKETIEETREELKDLRRQRSDYKS